jgi:hypothetical protein
MTSPRVHIRGIRVQAGAWICHWPLDRWILVASALHGVLAMAITHSPDQPEQRSSGTAAAASSQISEVNVEYPDMGAQVPSDNGDKRQVSTPRPGKAGPTRHDRPVVSTGTPPGTGPRILAGNEETADWEAHSGSGTVRLLPQPQFDAEGDGARPPVTLKGSGSHLSGLRYDYLAKCARRMGGNVSVIIPSGSKCTFSASVRGWIDCSGPAITEADLQLGRLCH